MVGSTAPRRGWWGWSWRAFAGAIIVAVACHAVLVLPRRPSNDRDWTADGARLASARFDGSRVRIRDVRDFDYQSVDRWTERWEDRSYDLDSLRSVWFFVEPFSDIRGPAHTFVSFGFGDGARASYVAVSVEIRKEKGEHYHPLPGMLRRFELMYVVGDERDLVRLRTNFRRDSVFMYRVRATPQQARAMFTSMLERANALRLHPEFYNTLTSNCTTNIARHVNALVPGKVPSFSYQVVLPAFADELAYHLGLLDTTRAFADVRRAALINPLAERFADDSSFSVRIREGR